MTITAWIFSILMVLTCVGVWLLDIMQAVDSKRIRRIKEELAQLKAEVHALDDDKK